MKYRADLLYVAGGTSPKLLNRILHAGCLDDADLLHRIRGVLARVQLLLFLLSPEKFFVQKVQYDKVQTP